MANFLKLEDSYLGNDVLKNPNFNMLGPNVINSNFSEIADGTDVSVLSGWSIFQNATATIEGGKLKVVSNGDSASAKYDMSGLTAGKVYQFSCKAEGNLSEVGVAFSGYTDVSTLGGDIVFTFKPVSTGSAIYFTARNNGSPNTVEYSDISVKETGQVEYVPNPYFKGVADDTDVVTTDALWQSYGTPVSRDVVNQALVINTTGCGSTCNQGVRLSLVDIPNGEEVNFKIESVTGDNGNGALYLSSSQNIPPYGTIPTESGSVDYTFVKESHHTVINFRSAGNDAGITTYRNISIQPTNVFAYGTERVGTTNGNKVLFSNDTLSFSGADVLGTPAYSFVNLNTSLTLGSSASVLFKINVASLSGNFSFGVVRSSDNVYETINLKEGVNEVYFDRVLVSDNANITLRYSTTEPEALLVIDDMEYSQSFIKPNLIGVTNISTVSAPTNDSVVINNGLVDGADEVTIYYDEEKASSTVEMRNYFQDKIIEASNSNNTKRIINLKTPVPIKSVQVS